MSATDKRSTGWTLGSPGPRVRWATRVPGAFEDPSRPQPSQSQEVPPAHTLRSRPPGAGPTASLPAVTHRRGEACRRVWGQLPEAEGDGLPALGPCRTSRPLAAGNQPRPTAPQGQVHSASPAGRCHRRLGFLCLKGGQETTSCVSWVLFFMKALSPGTVFPPPPKPSPCHLGPPPAAPGARTAPSAGSNPIP